MGVSAYIRPLPHIHIAYIKVSEKMNLGMMMKSVSRIGLNFVRSIVNDLKYSFGDSDGVEAPHIVAPIQVSFTDMA